jgi:hypothetical protein
VEMSTQSHLTYRMEQGRPPSDILCSTDISRKTMGGGMGGVPPRSSRSGKGSRGSSNSSSSSSSRTSSSSSSINCLVT